MTRIIHIAGNSGSGKTLLSLNLGIVLAQKGRDVLLLDANLCSPDIAHYSDIAPAIFLNEFLDGERRLEETIMFHPSGMKMIPSMAEDGHIPAWNKKINHALLSLMGKAELVLVDSCSLNAHKQQCIKSADETIFITNDDFPSIVKAREFVEKMEKQGANVIGVVVNRKRKKSKRLHLEAILRKPIIAEIPYDEKLIDSINIRQPIVLTHPNSRASKSLKELARLVDIWA